MASCCSRTIYLRNWLVDVATEAFPLVYEVVNSSQQIVICWLLTEPVSCLRFRGTKYFPSPFGWENKSKWPHLPIKIQSELCLGLSVFTVQHHSCSLERKIIDCAHDSWLKSFVRVGIVEPIGMVIINLTLWDETVVLEWMLAHVKVYFHGGTARRSLSATRITCSSYVTKSYWLMESWPWWPCN